MNKTLIALAIVAALPVAAQADATISGSLTSKYKNSGAIDTDSRLSVAATEVLANGMTATAGFSITADTDDDTENSGTATLAGDFGKLTVGSIDADSAFQAGDVAGVVADTTEGASSTVSTVYGIHYAGTQAGLSVAAQLNASTGPTGAGTAQTDSSQMSATYDFNGITVGYGYASADADDATALGVNAAVTAFGASYAFGDLVVTAGKASTSTDALVSATYTMTADALTVKAQMDNFASATDKSDYQIDITYVLSDTVTLTSEVDKGKTTTMIATYTSGDMTASVSKTDDGTTDASIGLDFGNADLTLGRNGGTEETSLTYAVAF